MKRNLAWFYLLLLLSLTICKPTVYGADKDPAIRGEIIEMVDSMGTYKITLQVISKAMLMMKDAYSQNRPIEKKIPEEIWAKVINEVTTELDKDSYYDILVPIYQKYLSREDVREISIFYKSKTGRKLISVLPEIIKEGDLAGQEWAKKAMQRIVPRIEQKLKELGYPRDLS